MKRLLKILIATILVAILITFIFVGNAMAYTAPEGLTYLKEYFKFLIDIAELGYDALELVISML